MAEDALARIESVIHACRYLSGTCVKLGLWSGATCNLLPVAIACGGVSVGINVYKHMLEQQTGGNHPLILTHVS